MISSASLKTGLKRATMPLARFNRHNRGDRWRLLVPWGYQTVVTTSFMLGAS
jgi:hypothetical protein